MQPRRFSVDFVHPSRDDILLYFSDLYEMEHGMTIRLSPTKFILVRSERGARKDSLCLHKKLFSRSTVIFSTTIYWREAQNIIRRICLYELQPPSLR